MVWGCVWGKRSLNGRPVSASCLRRVVSLHIFYISLERRVLAPRRGWSGLVCSVLCAWAREAAAVLVQPVPYSTLEGTYLGRVTAAFCSCSLDGGKALNHYLLAKGNRQPLKTDIFSHCLRERKALNLSMESRARAGLVSKLL